MGYSTNSIRALASSCLRFSSSHARTKDLGVLKAQVGAYLKLPGNPLSKSAYSSTSSEAHKLQGHWREWFERISTSAGSSILPRSWSLVLPHHLEHFASRYSLPVQAMSLFLATYLLWRGLSAVASGLVGDVGLVFKYMELPLVAGLLVVAVRHVLWYRYRVDPRGLHRHALLQLNLSPAALEVMGAPIRGCEVQAMVVSDSRMFLRGLMPQFRSGRATLMFPIQGSARTGMVVIQAKKRRGQYEIEHLTVDLQHEGGRAEHVVLLGAKALSPQDKEVVQQLRGPLERMKGLLPHYFEQDQEEDRRLKEEEEKRAREREVLAGSEGHVSLSKEERLQKEAYAQSGTAWAWGDLQPSALRSVWKWHHDHPELHHPTPPTTTGETSTPVPGGDNAVKR